MHVQWQKWYWSDVKNCGAKKERWKQSIDQDQDSRGKIFSEAISVSDNRDDRVWQRVRGNLGKKVCMTWQLIRCSRAAQRVIFSLRGVLLALAQTKLPHDNGSNYDCGSQLPLWFVIVKIGVGITNATILQWGMTMLSPRPVLVVGLCLLQVLCVSARSFVKGEPFQSWKAPAG